jgi:glycosyltransferase involved in cell wall biosynthesis
MRDMHSLPIVSVVIPCYNAAQYIDRCLESVLSQDYTKIEIIVVDDGSLDSSRDIIKKYLGVTLISQQNRGACAARNNGLSLSNGKYIKFLDSDDYLEPNILKKQIAIAESVDENTIVYGDFFIQRDDVGIYQSTNIGAENQTASLFLKDILTTTPLHKKWMLQKIGGFDERFNSGQEWNLHIRLSSAGFFFHHIKLPIFRYNIHNSVDRISVMSKFSKKSFLYSLSKLEMTEERLGCQPSGDINAVLSYCYWRIGRALYRLGDLGESEKCRNKAKSLAKNYKYYWPIYYKVINKIFGFYMGERIFKLAYYFKENKYL